jgi:DNA processing protein
VGGDVAEAALRDGARLLAEWESDGIGVIACFDPEYPARLAATGQMPPLLFTRGTPAADGRAAAVIGTRHPSPAGLRLARTAARVLTAAGFTVVSGLAAGIDTAAHTAALEAGGRTVAVIGTGIRRAYPRHNARLQEIIAARGLVISQFWPDDPPAPGSFLARNAVMSAYCLATIVIEASARSGASAQARMALAQGRGVLLPRRLLGHEWARDFARLPGVTVADGPGALLAALDALDALDSQDDRRGAP